MSGVILFQKTVGKKEEQKSFQELLLKANAMRRRSRDKVDMKNFDCLRKAFEIQLNTFLLEERLIESDVFLCASYVARVLSEFGTNVPESWYMIDYIIRDQEEGGSGNIIKEGADTCFVLYSLYPERCERRAMKKRDYVTMGAKMYHMHYSRTGMPVMYHMANRFELMAEVTLQCVHRV